MWVQLMWSFHFRITKLPFILRFCISFVPHYAAQFQHILRVIKSRMAMDNGTTKRPEKNESLLHRGLVKRRFC
jgi:hypothetical protein